METPSTSPNRNMSKGLLPPSPTSVAIGNPGKKQQKPQTEGQVIAYDDRKKRTNELNQHTAQEMSLLSTIIADVDGTVLSPRSKTEEAHAAKPSISASTVSERADNGMTRSLADEIADNGEDKAYEFISSRSGIEVPIDSTSFPLAPPPPPKSEEAPTCTSTEQLSISGSASPGRSKKSPSSFVRAKRSFFSRLSKPQPSQVGQMFEEYIAEPPPVETEKPAIPETAETLRPPPYLNPMLVAFAANDRLDEAAAEEGVTGTKKEQSSKAKETQKTKLRKGASKLGKNKSKGLSASRHSSQNASEEDDASCSRADRVCRLFESETLWTIFTTTCS